MLSYYVYGFDQVRASCCYKNLEKSSSQLLVNLCVETEQNSHWKFKCWMHFAEIKSYYKEVWQKAKI